MFNSIVCCHFCNHAYNEKQKLMSKTEGKVQITASLSLINSKLLKTFPQAIFFEFYIHNEVN